MRIASTAPTLFAATVAAALTFVGIGCARERAARPSEELLSERATLESRVEKSADADVGRLFARLKREWDDHQAGKTAAPPVIDILIVSGGGDWGAFGAGVLKGWGRVADPALRRPEFDIVTGVSTGALIAPFAFIGDDASVDRVVELYRNPASDWAETRGLFTILFGTDSLAEVPGLERDMKVVVDRDLVARVAEAGRPGRLMYVSATNVDHGMVLPFEMGTEASRAIETGDVERFHTILLASAAIPGVFPPREIDGSLYVDGAITGNILYGARMTGERSFFARWERSYPGVPMPKMRYWVVFNNQLRFPPEVVQPVLGSVTARSLFISTQQATVAAIRHLFAQAAADRLGRGAEVEVRYISIDDTWTAKTPGPFVAETMNDLADMGERLGEDPKSWRETTP